MRFIDLLSCCIVVPVATSNLWYLIGNLKLNIFIYMVMLAVTQKRQILSLENIYWKTKTKGRVRSLKTQKRKKVKTHQITTDNKIMVYMLGWNLMTYSLHLLFTKAGIENGKSMGSSPQKSNHKIEKSISMQFLIQWRRSIR